jgi:glycosyltransferase involved in cell wall biosynthesis
MTQSGPLAFYVPSLTVGGAERVTVSVANGLAERGYDVHLLVSYYEGSFVGDVDDAVTVFDLETPRIPGLGIGASVPRLVSYLRRQSPAMLFAQMIYASDVVLVAHALAGSDARVVPTVHNTVGMHDPPKERLVQRLATLLRGRAARFVAVSDGAAASVVEELSVPAENVSVLHNPIPVDDVRGQACEAADHEWVESDAYDVVLGIGRLAPQKDFETFLRAFAHVNEADPDTRAIIVGRGPERDSLESTARELGIGEMVDFTGYVDNPYSYMAGADVLAMSSVHEGLPTVLIEALACGCPVVSTDCPSGPRTILEGGTYGPLVEVGDADALAEAVLETLGAPPDRSTLVERARDFAPERVLEDYESFITTHGPVSPVTEPAP